MIGIILLLIYVVLPLQTEPVFYNDWQAIVLFLLLLSLEVKLQPLIFVFVW